MTETPGRTSPAEIIADLVKSGSVVEIRTLRSKVYDLTQSVKGLKQDKQVLRDELNTAKDHRINVVVHVDKDGNFVRYDAPKECNVRVERQTAPKEDGEGS